MISSCYPHLDLFMPSINEAKHIAGTDDPEAMAEHFIARGVKTAIVKLGARGCYVRDSENAFHGGIYPVKPIDTTGAGDAFAVGFLHARLNGLSLEMCARWGAVSGARAIFGATDGVPSGEELREWMEKAEYRLP